MGRGTRARRTGARAAPVASTNDLGARLRAARSRAGLTQSQAGAGLSASYVSAVERGKILPSLAAIERIAQRIGVAVAELLGAGVEPDQPAAAVSRALALIEAAATTAAPESRAALEACAFTLRAAAQSLARGAAL